MQKTIEEVVSPHTRGDPMKSLQWTCNRLRNIVELAITRGFTVSHELVKRIFKEFGYYLQSNRKTDEGGKHENRNAQFEKVNHV